MKTVYATPSRCGRAMIPGDSLDRGGCPAPPAVPSALPIPRGLLPASVTEGLMAAWGPERGRIEEIRLRAGRTATLTVAGANMPTGVVLTSRDLTAILTHLCGGSLYAYSQTINQGFLTLPGGIRVGVAGRAVCEDGRVIGVCEISSLCIRLPHRHIAVGGEICRLLRHLNRGGHAPRGVLIYAPPGEGKTTLLRAVAAEMSALPVGTTASSGGERRPWRTVVVDTRGELEFSCDDENLCLDVLRGYPRARGVEIATRTLSAQLIVCDEIGDTEEAMALISAHHGGVPLVATAHGGSVRELMQGMGIRLLHDAGLFGAYVGIRRDGRGGFIHRMTPRQDALGAPPPGGEDGGDNGV